MKRTKIAVAVAFFVAAPGVSLAAVTINQSGATHTTNWTQNGGANADILVNQTGAIAHQVDIIQAGTPSAFGIEVNQAGDFIGNKVNIRQIKTNPTDNSILVNQDGNNLDTNIQALGDPASSDVANDYTVDQTGEDQEVDVISNRSSGDLVGVTQGGIGQIAKVNLTDAENTSVMIDQDGADNRAEGVISASGVAGGTSLTIGQTGTENFAKLTSSGDKNSTVNILQADDSNDGRVFLTNTDGVTASIFQDSEGDNNTAKVTANNSKGSNASVTQQGDVNEATVLLRNDGLATTGSTVNITQGDNENFARANVLNSNATTVTLDQSAPGDVNEAVAIVRESSGSTVGITQAGNEQVADVFLKDDVNSTLTIDQGLGQNAANVNVVGSLDSTLTIDQQGRLSLAFIDGIDLDSATATISQDASSFENFASISLDGANGTAASISQGGEGNNALIIGSISDTNSTIDITQADDVNIAEVDMQESANLVVAIAQGEFGGDENRVLTSLIESNRTELSINQNGNENRVGDGMGGAFEFTGDRGSVVSFIQADDRNVILGSINESRFALNVNQGVTGGDENSMELVIDNANQTVVNINQNDNLNVAMLDISNDFDSIVSITQSNLGVAHDASIVMNDTQDGNFSIDQSGLGHIASISATDVLGASAAIVQSGGSGNIATATLVNGDDGVALAINQIDCFQCTATADSGTPIVNQP